VVSRTKRINVKMANFLRCQNGLLHDKSTFMESEAATTGKSTAPGTRVLLADDSANERAALAQYLRRLGYTIIETSDGKATIEHLQTHEVDSLLLDLDMPVADGFDVLGYLQKHRRGLPVILLSGMPLDQIQQHIHGLPVRELPPLMLKPIDVDQLTQVMEMQLSGDLSREMKQDQPTQRSM
jgi:CheY-like chemotaxis protein